MTRGPEAGDPLPRLYAEFAAWWPLLSAPEDYAEEAAFYLRVLREHAGPVRTLLELGSGGGNTASHLRHHTVLTLVEPSAGMREVSRKLNPGCDHVAGDMRDVRLGRTFDAVFVHDAVSYMTTAADLQRALATAFEHCRPGGAALFAPDHLRDTFTPSTDHGGHDGVDRGLRYLEWTHDPDPLDTTCTVDYAFLLREGESVRVVHDRHVLGVFARADWLQWLADAGFEAREVPFEHSEFAPGERVVFVGRRPA